MTPKKYINREITWLKFNARVLQEANDKSVPLIERLRFLGIYSNNLDEFYKVRYATVKKALQFDQKAYNNIVRQPLRELFIQIQDEVAHQQKYYDQTYVEIQEELEKEQIYFLDEKMVEGEHIDFINNYFQNKLSHTIAVYFWEPSKYIPELKDGSFYLVVKLNKKEPNKMVTKKLVSWLGGKNNQTSETAYAMIEVPTHVFSRFVILPQRGDKKYIMLLEDVIRYHLKEIFSFLDYDTIYAHSLKITKDAELDVDQDVKKSLLERIAKSVEGRKKGEPVRLVYDREMEPDTLQYLKDILHIDSYDNISPGGKYHNKKDFLAFPDIGRNDLEFTKIKPIIPPDLVGVKSYIRAVEKKDYLLYAPYMDYSVFLKFLRESAIDPRVESIKITIYRVANKSQIMSALINAAKNGKKVTAVLELRARFDEANNVNWSKTLQDEGVNVIFGVPGLKVHSKIGVVTYKDGAETKKIGFVSTGNFHEKTARIYTDFTLLTANTEITKEIDDLFKFFDANYKVKKYKHLIVSPTSMRKKIYRLINQEVKNYEAGLPAQINLKINSLSDKGVIDRLCKASQAGVEVRLVIRGICCLVPGIKGWSENIKAVSVVDKFLEHPRIYWFKNGGDDLVYISSADMMPRNINNRVEVGCPILDSELKQQVIDTFELSLTDNVKARIHSSGVEENYQTNQLDRNQSQVTIYEYFKQIYEY